MTTITSRKNGREDKYDKAKRIISDPARVLTSANADPPHWWTGMVVGDHGTYMVFAISPEMAHRIDTGVGRVGCVCRAGSKGTLCSHAIVGEEMRLRGDRS